MWSGDIYSDFLIGSEYFDFFRLEISIEHQNSGMVTGFDFDFLVVHDDVVYDLSSWCMIIL